MRLPRILLAGLFHETNTFVEELTGLDAFRVRRGVELLATRDNGSPLGAFVAYAEKRGWPLIPTVDYRAMPSGMVRDAVVETFWAEFEARARSSLEVGVDAIYLVLHGAMVSESMQDVEGTMLERIRALPGAEKIPIFGVTDLHGNFTERMARYANLLVTYRKNPHTDGADAARHAGDLLGHALETNRIPRTRLRQFPIVWPATGTGTSDPPMMHLEEAARRLEGKGHWTVNVYAGFAFADTHDTGVSVAIADDFPEERTETALDEMEALALRHQTEGLPKEWKLKAALDAIASSRLKGPALLVEPADNIGGGAPGDCTTVLRALVGRQVGAAGVILNDPESVRALESISFGRKICVPLGGKGSRLDPGPLALEVELLRRTDGIFELEDRQSHLASMEGTRIDMGRCAVVSHGETTLLLTSRKTPPFDLGQWRSQGIAPEQFSVINVKAAVAHRRAYDKIAAASYTVSTPGPCSSQLKSLPYRRIRHPIFPLDPR